MRLFFKPENQSCESIINGRKMMVKVGVKKVERRSVLFLGMKEGL